MPDIKASNVTIKVSISQVTELGTYNDSLYYSFEEFDALTDEELQAAIQSRVDSWVAFAKAEAEKTPVVPSDEVLLTLKDEKLAEIAEIDAQLLN